MSNLIIVLYILTTCGALVLLKLGAGDTPPISFVNSKLAFNLNVLILLGGGLYITSFALYTYLITKFDLGYIVPLTAAFVYTLIFLASFFIFNESFTLIKILAIGLITIGIILLTLK